MTFVMGAPVLGRVRALLVSLLWVGLLATTAQTAAAAAQPSAGGAAQDHPGEASSSQSQIMLDGAGADAEIHPDGDSVSISLLPGESQGFVFVSDEGHRYRVSVPATTVRAGRLVVRIFAPDESMLVESQALFDGWHWDIGSAQAGSYRVEVDPVGDYAGSVTVHVALN